MSINPFLNSERQLRNGWWILIFFLVLASILMPALLVARQYSIDVSIGLQAVIVVLASLICQWLRRKPLVELLGKFNARWFKELWLGALVGSALMLFPALIMQLFSWVDWQWNPTGSSTLPSAVLLFAGVAAAEELLFRGKLSKEQGRNLNWLFELRSVGDYGVSLHVLLEDAQRAVKTAEIFLNL